MNDKRDNEDVPFFISEDEGDDDEVFSSAPTSASKPQGDADEEVFSSIGANQSQQRSHSAGVTGGYAAVPGPSESSPRQKVVIGGDTSAPRTEGGAPLAGNAPALEFLDARGDIAQTSSLGPGRTLIGSSPRCDIALPNDPFLSNYHVAVYRSGDELVLEETSSYNGVYLRIADEFALEDGDEIILGNQRFLFRLGGPMPSLFETPSHQPPLLGAAASTFAHIIRVLEGGTIGGLYPLQTTNVIGRTNGDIVCPEDPNLADTHAKIERAPEHYLLYDLQTSYGTYIRVSSAVELFNGDCFIVGRTRVRLRV